MEGERGGGGEGLIPRGRGEVEGEGYNQRVGCKINA